MEENDHYLDIQENQDEFGNKPKKERTNEFVVPELTIIEQYIQPCPFEGECWKRKRMFSIHSVSHPSFSGTYF